MQSADILLLLLMTRLAWRLVQKLQGHVTHKQDDMFGRQRKRQGQQRRQYEVANKYVFKCRLKVDSDDDDVTNDAKLFHARAATTGKARSPIVLRRVTGTTTAVDELERRLRLVPTSGCRRGTLLLCR